MKASPRVAAGLAILLLVLLLTAGTAWAARRAPIDTDVATTMKDVPGATIPVIVFSTDRLDKVTSYLGNTEAVRLPLLNAVAAELTADQITTLANLPSVASIRADDDVVGIGWTDSLSFTNFAIGLPAILPPWQDGPTGDGVTVAIIDSGLSTHTDLRDADGTLRLLAFKDFVKNRRRAYDDAGHGTFVAGLIAGNGSASLPLDQGGSAIRQYRGVAPEADIVSLKVLDKFGTGRESDVIRAIAWTIANRERYDIRVLNLSLGGDVVGPVETDPMAQAVEAAWKAGIVVVCAAGNEGEFGSGGILSPGNDPYVITVGATDTRQTFASADDAVANYSSAGPTMFDEIAKPDLVAPGNRNVSLRSPHSYVDRFFPENRLAVSEYITGAPPTASPQYFVLSGTSTAAPVVSGIVALMLDEQPDLTPDDVKLRLMATADPLPGATTYQQGAGIVDVPGALSSTLTATGYTLSEKVGSGDSILPADTYERWNEYKWTRYRWTRYRWTRYRWTRYRWTRYRWTTLLQGQ